MDEKDFSENDIDIDLSGNPEETEFIISVKSVNKQKITTSEFISVVEQWLHMLTKAETQRNESTSELH